MLYKFRSKAGADVIMLSAHGAQVLRWLQRDPAAPGIIEHHDLPEAIARLEAALNQEPQQPREAATGESDESETVVEPVLPQQRYWPLLALMRESLRLRVDVVWGV